jgi:hypothetical protein
MHCIAVRKVICTLILKIVGATWPNMTAIHIINYIAPIMQQITFLKQIGYSNDAVHGGAMAKGKRKTRRPLDSKRPVHLILRSSKARGVYSFKLGKNKMWIYKLVHEKAEKFGLQLQGFANVGNHLHFKLKFKRREQFQGFLKSITSLIARHVTGARKGQKFGKFWDFLAYTKVVKVWAQEVKLDNYIVANAIEGEHGSEWREKFLKKWKHKRWRSRYS